MNMNYYQNATLRTWANYGASHSKEHNLAYLTLGLNGESGEVAEHVKKYMNHKRKIDVMKLKYELGDVLWYLAVLANEFSLSLDDIAQANLAKLDRRHPDGWSIDYDSTSE